MPARHDLAGAHRDGLPGNILQGLEPPLAHLLLLAPLVQLHHLVGKVGLEVGRRVVEGDMGVLPDADDPHVHHLPPQFGTQGGDVLLHIALPVDEVGGLQVHLGYEALLQVLAEACDVALAQLHILVQVEHLHLAPVDGLLRQGLHRLELARPGGEDDPRLPLASIAWLSRSAIFAAALRPSSCAVSAIVMVMLIRCLLWFLVRSASRLHLFS